MAAPVFLSLDLGKCLLQILKDIIDIFQTTGKTDHPWIDACCNQLLFRKLTMRLTRRMQYARADICYMHLIAGQFQAVHELHRIGLAALDDQRYNTTAMTAQIFLSQRMLRIIDQPRIRYRLDLR